ncbi:histidine kinase dimerization/phosphoacceptor domain -containing protein [uncultured Aquimarina sp.]|uniref:histidine kinase dimerization/phosphoacceptor domain -containing protein n=1 Tax=uncultured Aquimarina sp. TaxID=575652 RepID=UPI002603035E|nr:histidine kinase dimerization/phosphoacceptor domain -containing protein [uncultured Aquimarina sp.]
MILLFKPRRFLVLFLLIWNYNPFYAQLRSSKEKDSLKKELSGIISSHKKIQILRNLSKLYYPNELDSLSFYTNELRTFSDKTNNNLGKVNVLLLEGIYQWANGNFEEALKKDSLALILANKINNVEAKDFTYHQFGITYGEKYDYKKAVYYAEKSLIEAKKYQNKNTIALRSVNVSRCYYKLKKYDKALQPLLPLLKDLRSNKLNNLQKSLVLSQIGIVYAGKKENLKAQEYLERGLETAFLTGDETLIVKRSIRVMIFYYLIKEYEKALEIILPISEILEKDIINNWDKELVYSHLGRIYSKNKEYERTIEAFKKAYKISVKIQDTTKQIIHSINTAEYLIILKRYEDALAILSTSMKTIESTSDKKYKINAINKIAEAYIGLKDYKKAISYYSDAVVLAKTLKNNYVLGNAYTNLGKVQLKTLDVLGAKASFEKAKRIFITEKEITKKKVLGLTIYKSLALIDSFQQNYSSSLTNYKKYISIKNKITEEDRAEKLKQIEISFETDKKNKEIEILSTQNKLKELEAEEDFIIRLSLIISSFLLLLLLVIVNNRYRIKKNAVTTISKQKEIIEEKNNENELLIKEIHHRVKNNLQIISSLLNVHKNANIDNDKVTEVITESQNKIKSMVLIHQNLYNSNNFSKIHTSNYLKDLLNYIKDSYEQNSTKRITIKTDIESNEIPINLAVSLGLIVNELVTNSYKYAFTESNQKNHVFIKFRKNVKEKIYKLEVFDNGKGMPVDFNINHTETFGLQMVKGLILQLDGDIKIQSATTGTNFNIFIKDKNIA